MYINYATLFYRFRQQGSQLETMFKFIVCSYPQTEFSKVPSKYINKIFFFLLQ